MAELKQTKRAKRLLNEALECCISYRHEFVMPEHLLLVLLEESWASYLLKTALGNKEATFMSQLISMPDYKNQSAETSKEEKNQPAWKNLVTCMNELYEHHNPLIGREQELQRTIQEFPETRRRAVWGNLTKRLFR